MLLLLAHWWWSVDRQFHLTKKLYFLICRKYCFQKTLIELIQAPDYYLSYMIKKHRVHDIPIGKI